MLSYKVEIKKKKEILYSQNWKTVLILRIKVRVARKKMGNDESSVSLLGCPGIKAPTNWKVILCP